MGHVERRVHHPHEVSDHPDVDLSARLVHLWSHNVEVGVYGVISVWDSMVAAPLGGAALASSYWSTISGDTRSFSKFSRLLSSLGEVWIVVSSIQIDSIHGMMAIRGLGSERER